MNAKDEEAIDILTGKYQGAVQCGKRIKFACTIADHKCHREECPITLLINKYRSLNKGV